ncbi:DNA internalization-related competence protein ComEC/Rec2 [Fusibacter paucivorans]|uniref:DNA internalization-related competence protein ComEC/Rec2 n=1 Tax=Fusibacter paucivorans TaxID=76009 RepID=A0ABS5PPG1_9FIRM|nr:DNA internalization-related competence protein ComEC/Rec2 [Fusibacter paucivorans]MBS7526792.1 DNA internalization-related competence protein ComEC/Rec2 [Fusibacter paucivorans]
MSRKLVLLHHVLWILLWFLLQNQYSHMIVESRVAYPSNIQRDMVLKAVHGRITSYDYAKQTVRFKTDDGIQWLIVKIPETDFESMLHSDNHGTISIDANEAQWTSTKNPNVFDYDRYLFASHIEGCYTYENYMPDQIAPHGILGFRNRVYLGLKNLKLPHLSSILTALFFGEAEALSTYETYRELGVLHLFTISGLHFGVLYIMFNRLFCIGDIRVRKLLTALVMLLFYLLIGGGVASLRALLMAGYTVAASIIKRPVDRLNMMIVTNMIIMLTMPRVILTAAYALSFYAYIGVAYILPKFNRYISIYTEKLIKHKVGQYLLQYIAVQVYLIPITLYVFQTFNLFSFIANALLIPVYGFLMPILTAYFFMFAALPKNFLMMLIGKVLNLLLGIMEYAVGYLPIKTIAFYGLQNSDIFCLLILFFLFTAAIALKNCRPYRRHVLYIGIQMVLVLTLTGEWYHRADDTLKITAIDVGHGDSSLIQYDGLNILVDCGTAYANVYTYLLANHINHIDYLVISHRHDDHIGGLTMISKKLDVEAVICLSDVKDMIESEGITCRFLPPSGEIVYKDLKLTYHYALSDSDPNNNSTLMLLTHRDFNAVFTGDLSGHTLNQFMLPSDIDLLKVPHHGSATGYDETFFNEHHVDVAVFSQNRRYHMPSSKVVEAYQRIGAKLYTTFNDGNIQLTVDDDQVHIQTYLGSKDDIIIDD